MGEKKDQVLNQIGITVCIALVLLVAWVFFLENLVMDLMGLNSSSSSSSNRWVFSVATLGIIGCALIYPCLKLLGARSLVQEVEQALLEERAFNRIVNNVDNSIVLVTDSSGKISQMNQKAGQILGFRGKEILGKDWAQALMPETFRNQARKILHDIAGDRNKGVETFKSPVICKNKMELTIEWQAGPFHGNQGDLQGIVLSGIDITTQFRLKGELDSLQKHYEPQIKQLSSNLSDSKRKLEDEARKNREARMKFQFWVDFDKNLLTIDEELKNNRSMVDNRINQVLNHLGDLTNAESGYVFLFVDNNKQMINSHIWNKEDPSLEASPDDWIDLDIFPWFKSKIENKELVHAKNLESLPDDASNEKEVFHSQGVKSFINVPIVWKNDSIGYIGFETTSREKSWTTDEISMIRIFSKTLGPILIDRLEHTTVEPVSTLPIEQPPEAPPASTSGSLLEDALLEISVENNKANESQDALQEVKAEYEQEIITLKEQMRTQQDQWQALNEELQSTRSSLELELENRKKSEEELSNSRESVQQELMDLNAQLEQAHFQLEERADEKSRLSEEKVQIQEQLENLRATFEEEKSQFQEKSEESSNKDEELAALQAQHESTMKAIEENLQDKEEEIIRKTAEIDSMQEKLGMEAVKRQQIESDLEILNQKMNRQEQENNALSLAHGMLQSELDDLKKVQQDFDATLHEMEEKEKSFEDYQKEMESDLLLQKQLVDTLENQVKQFGQLDLPVVSINDKGSITEWNKAAENILGPTDYEAIGQGLQYLLSEETEFDIETHLLTPLAEEGTLEITLPLATPGGDYEETTLHFTALHNSEGVFDGAIAYLTPPRGEAFAKVEAADSLFEYSDFLVFRLSPSFETLDINPAATRMSGLERKDVFEKDFFNLIFNDEQAAEYREDVLDVFKSKTNSDFECVMKLGNNEERTILFNLIKQENESGDIHSILAIGQDLTELRQSEKLLKENETLLGSIVDHSADGFITIDENGIIQSFNSGAEKVFGYGADETIGQNINLLMPEPYRSEHGNYISNYLVTGTAKVVGKPPREFMAQKKDGTVFPVEVAVREIFQDYRRMFVGIVHDISRRKAVEQALKESEEKFRKILSAESDAILIINATTRRLLEVNESAVRMFGYDRDEILRLKLTDISTEPEKKTGNGSGTGIGLASQSFMRYHKKKDGTVFPAEVSSSTFMAHNQKLYLRVVRDISERVRMEENLREGEEHLQHILNNTPAAIYLKDSEGRYRTVNKQFADLFRVGQNEVRGKADHDIFPQDLADEFKNADMKVLESGSTFESKDTILYSDGAHIFDTIKFPLRNSSGVLYGLVGILTDITQRTRLEEELQNVRNHLEDMVVKRTEQLKTVQDKKVRSEKLRATAQLAGVVAQQINNPIHGIRNILEQVGERVQMEDIHKGLVDIAIKECGRVSDLLARLKDCHTPETDEPEDMDLNQVIEEVVSGDQEKLGDQVTFEKHFAQGLPQVSGSTTQIRQALGHLLQNAEEALPDHKGKILIATERDENLIKIHIQDSGCGIPPENMDVIFDPFFTTKSAFKRSGLGLLLTLGVIKNHHGDIEVKSQPGKGTTFTVMLPVKAE